MKGTSEPGIKCPSCGSSIHDVKDTRKKGVVVVRTRECYNHHRFQTEERVVGTHRREKVRARVLALLKESRKYSRSDPRYKTVKVIAAEVGVSSYTVFRIARGEIAVRQLRRKSS